MCHTFGSKKWHRWMEQEFHRATRIAIWKNNQRIRQIERELEELDKRKESGTTAT